MKQEPGKAKTSTKVDFVEPYFKYSYLVRSNLACFGNYKNIYSINKTTAY